MPMKGEDFGNNKDGSKSREYCRFCFKNGRFTDEGITVEEKIEKNVRIAMGMGMPENKARGLAESVIPKLKRWNRQLQNSKTPIK